MKDYWSALRQQRISRRRTIVASGAASAGALLLAACGSSSSSGGSSGSSGSGAGANKSGLIAQPVDTSKTAKRGGTMKWFGSAEPAHFDTNVGLSPLNTPNNLITSLLVNEKPGVTTSPEYSEQIPELAESWEWAPDRLSLTLKLRDGVKWHNKNPVNGRAFDVDDIIASWNRFVAKAQGRGNLANSVNPNAPVLGVTAGSDRKSVTFKLKDPIVYFMSLLTPGQTGSFQMFPKEVDSGYDPRKDLIGTGPFFLSNYTPSVGMTFKRNPDYWDTKNGPYVDQLEYPIVLEYAQQLAQLKAGNIYSLYGTSGSGIHQEDILQLKSDEQTLKMYAVQPFGFNPNTAIQFGQQPTDANKPFKDIRVRQAISMAHDRDTYIDVFNNVSKFQSSGLPVATYWNTALGAAPGWRLDPKDEKNFGPNASYFKYDVAEAKKLMAAAGYGNGVDIITSYIKGAELNTNGRDFRKQVDVRQDWLSAIGVRTQVNLIDYTLDYLPKYITNAGKFDGLVYRVGVAASNDAVVWLEWRYKTNSGDGWMGFDANGKGDNSGDPDVDNLINKARQEPDIDKRKALVNDLQRYLAKAAYAITEPGSSDTFDLAWPALQNHRVLNGDRRTFGDSWWIDDQQAPLKRS